MIGENKGTSPKDRGIVYVPRFTRNYFTEVKKCAPALYVIENHHAPSRPATISNIVENTIEEATCSDDEIGGSVDNQISMKHNGYKITSIDLDRDWAKLDMNHVRLCKTAQLDVIECRKNGYELIDTYQCWACMMLFHKRDSRDVMMGNSKRKSTDINFAISVGTYVSRSSISKTNELCSEVGLIHPDIKTMVHTRKKLKSLIFDLSNEQLRLNRKDHVQKVRVMPDYDGDIVFTKGSKAHSMCRATLAMYGASNTQAYAHRIRGNQHSMITYSVLTMKPMIVISH